MAAYELTLDVAGPWSLATSRRFWEDFAPAAIPASSDSVALRADFLSEHDWTPAHALVTQNDDQARIRLTGDGDLRAAAGQVTRFLSLDVDATAWPEVGSRDPVIAHAQSALPGLRPCGFHSAYEAAAWAVLSQRTRVRDAARLRRDLIARHGEEGAFPAPSTLSAAIETGTLVLPGRKAEYLNAVAYAARTGILDSRRLRALPEDEAREQLRAISGIGPFATDLILIRGANTTDVLPRAERRLADEIAHLYGPDRRPEDIAAAWRPFRSWAAVHLRALREARTHEMG